MHGDNDQLLKTKPLESSKVNLGHYVILLRTLGIKYGWHPKAGSKRYSAAKDTAATASVATSNSKAHRAVFWPPIPKIEIRQNPASMLAESPNFKGPN